MIATGTALNGCGGDDGQRYYSFRDGRGMPAVLGPESYVRDWLAYIHMQPADADCFVAKIKASRHRQNPVPQSANVPPERADQFARDCGVDFTGLYTISHGD